MKLDEFGLANLQKWTNLHLNISKLEKDTPLKQTCDLLSP